MKVKICSYLTITLVVILFTSCDKSNEKMKDDESLIFTIHRYGGFTGLDEILKINAGTTHYTISYYDLSTSKLKTYQTTIKTKDELWNFLTNTFELEAFTKIKDGSCRSCVDGIDETISVIKDGETYSFYNGVVDEHYQQLQVFFDSIFKQIEDFEIIAKFRE
jgi:hypothetical protein